MYREHAWRCHITWNWNEMVLPCWCSQWKMGLLQEQVVCLIIEPFLSPDFYIQYSSPKFNNYINFHCILNDTYEVKIAVIISRLHLRLTTKDDLEPAHHFQEQAAIHGYLPPAHNNKPMWGGSENCSCGEIATAAFSSDNFFFLLTVRWDTGHWITDVCSSNHSYHSDLKYTLLATRKVM